MNWRDEMRKDLADIRVAINPQEELQARYERDASNGRHRVYRSRWNTGDAPIAHACLAIAMLAMCIGVLMLFVAQTGLIQESVSLYPLYVEMGVLPAAIVCRICDL